MKKNNFFKIFDTTFSDFFENWDFTHKKMFANGKTKVESGNDELGQWTQTSYKSDDGSITYTSFVRTNSYPPVNSKKSKLTELKEELKSLIEKQDFEKAAEIRDRIKLIEKNSETINELRAQLKKHVESEEFEKAAEVRDKLKTLEN